MRIVWVIQGENMQSGLYFLVVISTGSLKLLLNKGASVKHTLLQTTENKKIIAKNVGAQFVIDLIWLVLTRTSSYTSHATISMSE